MDTEDEVEIPVHEMGEFVFSSVMKIADKPGTATGTIGESAEPVMRRQPQSDSLENPFVEPFTPSK